MECMNGLQWTYKDCFSSALLGEMHMGMELLDYMHVVMKYKNRPLFVEMHGFMILKFTEEFLSVECFITKG